MKSSKNDEMLTFGGHLEVFRRMLFRIIAVAGAIAMIVFCFKETTWALLLAPSEWSFLPVEESSPKNRQPKRHGVFSRFHIACSQFAVD